MCARTLRIAIVIPRLRTSAASKPLLTHPGLATRGTVPMVTPDSDSTPADSTIDAALGRPPAALASTGGQGRLVGMALVAGLLAGVAAWLVGETILEAYRGDLTPKVKREVDAELVAPVRQGPSREHFGHVHRGSVQSWV